MGGDGIINTPIYNALLESNTCDAWVDIPSVLTDEPLCHDYKPKAVRWNRHEKSSGQLRYFTGRACSLSLESASVASRHGDYRRPQSRMKRFTRNLLKKSSSQQLLTRPERYLPFGRALKDWAWHPPGSEMHPSPRVSLDRKRSPLELLTLPLQVSERWHITSWSR